MIFLQYTVKMLQSVGYVHLYIWNKEIHFIHFGLISRGGTALEVLFYFSHRPADKHVHLRSLAASRHFAAWTRQGAT